MDDIKLLLFIGISGMLLLFVSFLLIFVFSQRKKLEYQKRMQSLKESQNRQLIEAAIRSEEKERHRISETLHDEVGAILSAAKLYIQGVAVDNSNEQNKQFYQKGKELLNEAIRKVRDISHNLHSGVLQQLGLNEGIRHFTDKMALDSLLEITTDLDDSLSLHNQENTISLFRLVQELLNNTIKHAHPTHIHIRSASKEGIAQFIITHNGAGLEQAEYEALSFKKEGLGLKNIQNRMILLKGNIFFSKQANEHKIMLSIPLQTFR